VQCKYLNLTESFRDANKKKIIYCNRIFNEALVYPVNPKGHIKSLAQFQIFQWY